MIRSGRRGSKNRQLPQSSGRLTMGDMRTVDDARERVRAEYLEMPGLHLTIDQVQRLCGIERRTCTTVLEGLVEERFLCVKPNGAYARAWDGYRPRAAKVTTARQAVITGRRAS